VPARPVAVKALDTRGVEGRHAGRDDLGDRLWPRAALFPRPRCATATPISARMSGCCWCPMPGEFRLFGLADPGGYQRQPCRGRHLLGLSRGGETDVRRLRQPVRSGRQGADRNRGRARPLILPKFTSPVLSLARSIRPLILLRHTHLLSPHPEELALASVSKDEARKTAPSWFETGAKRASSPRGTTNGNRLASRDTPSRQARWGRGLPYSPSIVVGRVVVAGVGRQRAARQLVPERTFVRGGEVHSPSRGVGGTKDCITWRSRLKARPVRRAVAVGVAAPPANSVQ